MLVGVRVDSKQLGESTKGPKLEWHVHMKQRLGPIYLILAPYAPQFSQ